MKSWKEEKLHKPLQGAKALREYTSSGDGYKAIYDYAYGAFIVARQDVHDEFDDKYDPDVVEFAIRAAVTDAFDDFLSE